MPHGDPTITRHRDPGLDLLQIGAPVFRMTIRRRRIRRITVLIGTIQRNRGHIPVQTGHIDPERLNRRRTNGSDDVFGLFSDRVQRPTQTVIIEERDEDLIAARATNRELMAQLNAPLSARRI
jgi:hypothetical protein